MNNQNNNFDTKLLERMLQDTVNVYDRNGHRAYYYVPTDEKVLDVCARIFELHGIKMEKYKSGMYPMPVLKITLAQINNLTDQAREFLFGVNVPGDKLRARLAQIYMGMSDDRPNMSQNQKTR